MNFKYISISTLNVHSKHNTHVQIQMYINYYAMVILKASIHFDLLIVYILYLQIIF